MRQTCLKSWCYVFTLLAVAFQSSVFAEHISGPKKYPFVFHLVQAKLWDEAVDSNSTYFPPTYQEDRFTHGTANPDKLLTVANHFYQGTQGNWYCLRMTTESLQATGVQVIFESTAPVGDRQPDFEGSDDELYPHIMGGISPDAVLEVLSVERNQSGEFLLIDGIR